VDEYLGEAEYQNQGGSENPYRPRKDGQEVFHGKSGRRQGENGPSLETVMSATCEFCGCGLIADADGLICPDCGWRCDADPTEDGKITNDFLTLVGEPRSFLHTTLVRFHQ